MKAKIHWVETNRKNELRASVPVSPRGFETFLREEDFEPISQWCNETGIGRRMSFDLYQFKTKAEVTAFLLRWA